MLMITKSQGKADPQIYQKPEIAQIFKNVNVNLMKERGLKEGSVCLIEESIFYL